jgi:hypothetical protein
MQDTGPSRGSAWQAQPCVALTLIPYNRSYFLLKFPIKTHYTSSLHSRGRKFKTIRSFQWRSEGIGRKMTMLHGNDVLVRPVRLSLPEYAQAAQRHSTSDVLRTNSRYDQWSHRGRLESECSNNGIPPKLKCLSPQNPYLPVQLRGTAFQILLVH